jgi:hypothetical protein
VDKQTKVSFTNSLLHLPSVDINFKPVTWCAGLTEDAIKMRAKRPVKGQEQNYQGRVHQASKRNMQVESKFIDGKVKVVFQHGKQTDH